MNAQLDILKEAVELLGGLLRETTARLSRKTDKDIRRSFINRHAWNIHDLASDVLVLGESGNLRSVYLISRPALESLFKLSAAVMDEGFAAQKVVAEVEEERDKVRRWLAAAGPEWRQTLQIAVKELDDFGGELRKRYGVSTKRTWKTYEVAKLGILEADYVRDYFKGSKHVHAMLSSLVDREDALYVPDAIYRLTVSVTHASALLNRAMMEMEGCVAPDVFENAVEINRRAHEAGSLASQNLEAKLRKTEA